MKETRTNHRKHNKNKLFYTHKFKTLPNIFFRLIASYNTELASRKIA